MDPFVEGSLEWTALQAEDLDQLAELRTAIEYFDDPVERLGLTELEEYYSAPGADPSADAVVGRDKGGTIVAYGWNHIRGLDVGEPQVWLDGGVHPAWRHQQLGRRLLEWQVARAQEWFDETLVTHPELGRRVLLTRYVDEKAGAHGHLMEQGGFTARRWYFDMHRGFEDEYGHRTIPTMPSTDGIQLQPYHPELSEAVRLAHNEAFADVPGVHRVSSAAWEHSMRRRAARPQWSWVATHDGDVGGSAMDSA
ncbi:GNAT family N-acetyltransferase, partial [Luteococcus sp. H91]|uniref:GNAT family N-acetyltransferase n=1 Tax=Luteococcus sp. H91 TaxID=3139401 RepID=UPI00313B8E54